MYVGCRHDTHHTSHITTELFLSAKEPYISAKGPYVSAKEPYISAKEPYISAKEPYITAKEPYISAQEPFQPRGVTIARSLSHASALSLSFLLGLPLVFSLARSLVLSLPIIANPHAELQSPSIRIAGDDNIGIHNWIADMKRVDGGDKLMMCIESMIRMHNVDS